MPAAEVWADYDELLDSAKEGVVPSLQLESVEFLPSYEARLSEALAEWLESRRAVVHSAVRRHLVTRIARARRSARWPEVDRLARRCLALDEMNEEAVIALAEATAVTGSRALAASILDKYLADLGPDAKLLGRPARELRRRLLDIQGDAMELRGMFVGREVELATLTERLQLAVDGSGNAVVLWGPAGMGKTRLVFEFCRVATLRGITVVGVGCARDESAQPMSFFIQLMQTLIELPGALGASPDAVTQIRRLIGLRSGTENSDQDHRDASTPKRVVQASAEVLQAVSEETCVVLVAEDVHWLDDQSSEALSDLIHRSSGTRILFVLTSRQQSAETLGYIGSSGPLVLQLNRLSEEASAALLSSLMSAAASHDFRQWGAIVSEGNPLFLREIAEHARAHGEVRQLPPTLDAMLRARLSALSLRSLRVLQVVALLDKFASFENVENLLSIPSPALVDAIDALEQEGLIRADESGVRCEHHLIADAALSRLASATLRLLHRRAALVLESAWCRTRSTPIAWACSQHWRAAQADERATATTHACAQQLIAIGMPLPALQLLRDLPQSDMSRELLARHFELVTSAQRSAGQWAQVVSTIDQMRSVHRCDEPLDASYQLLQFDAGLRLGQPISQIIAGAVELACARTLPRRLRFESAALAATLADESLDARVLTQMLEAVADATTEDEEVLRDRVRLIYHSVHGQLSEALTLCRTLLARAEAKGNPIELCRALRHATIPLRLSGRLDEAIRSGERSMAMAHALAIPSAIFPSSDCLAGLYLIAGRPHEALRLHDAAEPFAPHAEDLRSHQVWLEQKARIYLSIGDTARGREIITRLDDRLSREPGRHRIEVLSLLARIGCTRSCAGDYAQMIFGLRADVLQAASWGSQDSCALAVVEALVSLEDATGAQQFAAEYCATRRERYPAPSQISALHNGSRQVAQEGRSKSRVEY